MFLLLRYNNGLTLAQIYDVGLGQLNVNWRVIATSDWPLSGTVLLANLPQLLISFTYVAYNGLLTSMIGASEFVQFAHKHHPLRVSRPVGGQRSTYWLQSPYWYAIPFMAAMTLLHWLVSQSIFLARTVFIDRYGQVQPAKSLSSCAWSPFAIIVSLGIGGCITLALVAMGLRTYASGIPIVANCSAAIAAACHTSSDEDGAEIVRLPLKYGVIDVTPLVYDMGEVHEHVGLSAKQGVISLQDGHLYT